MERVYAWNNDSIVELREIYNKKTEMVNNKDGSLLIMVEHE